MMTDDTDDIKNVLYGDTDSCYCNIQKYMERNGIPINDDEAVKFADEMEKMLFDDVPAMLEKKFLTPVENLKILEAGREGVFRGGIFKGKLVKGKMVGVKKRYALHLIDNEGKRLRKDESGEGKMKIMGMETQRSDTPVFVQEFLLELLKRVIIRHHSYEEVYAFVQRFKEEYHMRALWENGAPSRVSNVDENTALIKNHLAAIGRGEQSKIPYVYHVTKACIFTNLLIEVNGENRWLPITDGDKVQTLKLKTPIDGFSAVAIKTDEEYIPDWFKQLPFDGAAMEATLDKKIDNVIGVTGWDFSPPKTYAEDVTTTMDDWYE